jgi:hypothetical protein
MQPEQGQDVVHVAAMVLMFAAYAKPQRLPSPSVKPKHVTSLDQNHMLQCNSRVAPVQHRSDRS